MGMSGDGTDLNPGAPPIPNPKMPINPPVGSGGWMGGNGGGPGGGAAGSYGTGGGVMTGGQPGNGFDPSRFGYNGMGMNPGFDPGGGGGGPIPEPGAGQFMGFGTGGGGGYRAMPVMPPPGGGASIGDSPAAGGNIGADSGAMTGGNMYNRADVVTEKDGPMAPGGAPRMGDQGFNPYRKRQWGGRMGGYAGNQPMGGNRAGGYAGMTPSGMGRGQSNRPDLERRAPPPPNPGMGYDRQGQS